MEARPTPTPTRDSFVEWIDKRLTELSFCKSQNRESWVLKKEIQSGAQVVIINGQRHSSPGETRTVEMSVEIYGNGKMIDNDTSQEDEFIEMNFYITENNIKNQIAPTFCLFYDDNILFNSLINKLFGSWV